MADEPGENPLVLNNSQIATSAKVLKKGAQPGSVKNGSKAADSWPGGQPPKSSGKLNRQLWPRSGPARGRNNVSTSFVFVFLLLLSGILLVFLVFREGRNFEAILQEIDQIQGRGASVANIKLYQSAAKKADNERDYLRLIKRAYQIPDLEMGASYVLKVTNYAVKDIPGNENLWAYRAAALLNQDKLAQAIAASDHLESSRYQPLKGEILVYSLVEARAQYRRAERNSRKEDDIGNLSIAEVVRESPYTAATYINLARLLRQPRFAWNAALLYMLQGEKDKALALVRELQEQSWLNRLAAGLIAYDNKDWSLASRLFENERIREVQAGNLNAKTLQYLGDAYVYQGKYREAIGVLDSAIGLVDKSLHAMKDHHLIEKGAESAAQTSISSPEFDVSHNSAGLSDNLGSWELYYNLAAAYRELGENATAFEVLRQGRNTFPHASELLLLLNMVAPADEKEYAKSMLSELISKDTNNQPNLVLASLIFEEKRINRQKFSSKLWDLFSRFPQYDQILHYLLWYFIGLNRTEDVDLALERYRNLVLVDADSRIQEKDFPVWAQEYMAINATLKRDFDTAQSVFEDLIAQNPSWRIYYNMANLYVYQADFAAAVRLLRKSLSAVENTDNKVDIFYRMLVLAEISKQNYLSRDESDELDGILADYIHDNYHIHDRRRDPSKELLNMKLDSLVLWRELKDGKLLDDPESYRKGVHKKVEPHSDNTFVSIQAVDKLDTGASFNAARGDTETGSRDAEEQAQGESPGQ